MSSTGIVAIDYRTKTATETVLFQRQRLIASITQNAIIVTRTVDNAPQSKVQARERIWKFKYGLKKNSSISDWIWLIKRLMYALHKRMIRDWKDRIQWNKNGTCAQEIKIKLLWQCMTFDDNWLNQSLKVKQKHSWETRHVNERKRMFNHTVYPSVDVSMPLN
jgi:hypothetical protein